MHIKNISPTFVSATDITATDIVMNSSNNALTEATYYILLALVTPLHGYGIMQRTAELSSGRLMISAGTLYGALSTLMEKGWIEQLATVTDSRKKEYQITDIGLTVLRGELSRLEELARNGRNIIDNIK